jgi:hypothetical protein
MHLAQDAGWRMGRRSGGGRPRRPFCPNRPPEGDAPWARQDLVFTDIEAGSFFGELDALEGAPGSPSVFAVDDSTLAKMPSAIFVQTMFNHRPLGEAVVAKLVVRNRAMTRKVAEAAQTYGDRLPFSGPAPRPVQNRFDAIDDVCAIGANPRRARRWS